MQTVSAPAPGADAPLAPRYLTPKQAAAYTNIAVKTLEFWRRIGKGPQFIPVGRKIIYAIDDLDAYLLPRRVNNTAQAVDMQKAEAAQ